MRYWKSWHYKNLTFFLLSIVVGFSLSGNQTLKDVTLSLGSFGYIGAFFTGMLFVSTFTVTTAAFILLLLAEKIPIFELSLAAGLGAVVGDLTIFRFVKDKLLDEITPIYNRLGGNHITKIMHTKYFGWTLPVVGALIIASPLPDEIGVSLMGISNIKTYKFIILSFILNTIGIFLLLSTINALRT